ncbi:MAG: alkaline phosphatase family protein [Bacteroidales bacterium]|nr:alkaline phosphatase family protein [Bacteroidales bacterium]
MTIHTKPISFLFIILFFGLTAIQAQNRRAIPPEKPKLIVSIVVEQMRYDFIDRYWNQFEDNGFKRLILEGSFYKNAHLNYMLTQSSPGYASIYTGAEPSVHGIVADQWYKSISDQKIFSTKNGKMKTVGSASFYGEHSPEQLITSTVSDELKLIDKQSKVISVGIDPIAPVLSGGHLADGAYWLDPQTGFWISSQYYLKELPKWVRQFNDKKLADNYLNRSWTTLKELSKYVESRNDTVDYETGYGVNINYFPYDLAKMSNIEGKYPDYGLLSQVPVGNNYTKDFAIAAIVNEDLGKDAHPDFLMLNFTPSKEISNRFGPLSVEVEDTYLQLDKELAHFLSFLDQEIGKENVLIVLTSNHGVAYAPQFLSSKRIPAGNFKSTYSIALLKSYLNATYGHGDWIKLYHNQQIFLNRLLIEDSKINLEEFQQKIVDFIIQFDGVANAVASSTLMKSEFNRGIFEKMQNSYNQSRSGDIIINLEPGWLEDINTTSTSNSPYVYDTHVPLIWYGWRIKRQENNNEISIIDIAPTISALLNIAKPNGSTGKPIDDLLK